MTPRVSFPDCSSAMLEGLERKSGEVVEVCVPAGEARDVHVKVAQFNYVFRLVSVSKRTKEAGLMSMSADGCLMHPLFTPSHLLYKCEVDCRVGGRVLLAALKPASEPGEGDLQSVSLVAADGEVLSSELDQVITPVQLSDTGEPLKVRVVLGPQLDVGSKLPGNLAPTGSTVYRFTAHCNGILPTSTSTTTTTPYPQEHSNIAGIPMELEILTLTMLFGSIAVMLVCTLGRHEFMRLVDTIRGKIQRSVANEPAQE